MSAHYYWQGGRKIAIEAINKSATVQAASIAEVEAAAARRGVAIRKPDIAGPGLVRLELDDDEDASIEKLREEHVVHRVYHAAGQPDVDILITDTFFLKFKAEASKTEIDAYLRSEHLQVVDVFDALTLLVRVTDATGRNPIRASNSAADNALVDYAEPNVIRQLKRFSFIPADPLFSSQWHLHAPDDGEELAAGADIRAPDAWAMTLGSREVVIAVADDGHDVTHPDFQGQNKLAGRLNVVPDPDGVSLTFDENVLPQPGDYHGTPCSGVATAENNGIGTMGVAPGCQLLPVRFPLNMSEAQFARMFQRISQQADIVSCSWGVGPADAPLGSVFRNTLTQLAATGGKRGRGLIVCVAAGNNNCPIRDLNNTTTYQYLNGSGTVSSYSGPIDRWIAAHPAVITVSAVTSENKRAAYSSWGAEINVCAPSNNFHDLQAFPVPGRGIVTTDNEGFGTGSDFTPGSRYTGNFGGTSSATPTVAGVCALVLSANRTLRAEQVRGILQSTASKDIRIDSATAVNEPGDFNSAGFSRWYGFGRVDAAAAVAEALVQSGTEQTLRLAASGLPLAITDDSQTVVSHIDASSIGLINDLRIGVNITHTYVGDLRIELTTPNGLTIVLHNHSGGSQDNLNAIYSADNTPALAQLTETSVNGRWTLRVTDTWRMDSGQIDNWNIIAKVATDPAVFA